jgi:cytochrome c oxidase cbb3-type subunit 3
MITIHQSKKRSKMKNLNKLKSLSLLALLSIVSPSAKAATADEVVSDQTMLYLFIGFAAIMLILIIVLANVINGFTSNKRIWQYLKDKRNAARAVTALFLLSSATASAQETMAVVESSFAMSATLFWALVVLNALLVMVVFYLFKVLKELLNVLKTDEEIAEEPSVVSSWATVLTDTVSLEDEHEILTDHAYDGIRELDNNLPPWWVWGFYGTIIFAFVYVFYFQFLGGPSSTQEYQAEMEQARIEKEVFMASMANSIDESNVILLTDALGISEGKKLFDANCTACHGADGGSNPGGVGPNLVDEYWIHGGSVGDVFKSIKYGIPTKGMIAWESQMSPTQMQKLTSYILSLQGTTAADPKEPQGELYSPKEKTQASVENDNEEDLDATTDSTNVAVE